MATVAGAISMLAQFGILFRGYCYLRTLGPAGTRAVSENAVLNANYLLARLKPHFNAPFGDGPCMHEVLLDDSTLRRGEVVMRDGAVQAEPGTGRFLPRGGDVMYDDVVDTVGGARWSLDRTSPCPEGGSTARRDASSLWSWPRRRAPPGPAR